jgi:hypothetical protein
MLNFLSALSDSVATGNVFVISGKSSENAQKISISLACGKAGNSDIALMLLCNFSDDKIVRTSLVNGNWSESEDTQNLTSQVNNPINPGDDFKIYILVGDDRFHVSINDKAFCTYNFRLPLNQIKAVTVSGDVDKITQMDHFLVFPLIYPLVGNEEVELAFSGFIPRKFKPGHVVLISGVASGNPEGEFVIFFSENDSNRQLIHLNPRFDQQEVVINSMLGDEE